MTIKYKCLNKGCKRAMVESYKASGYCQECYAAQRAPYGLYNPVMGNDHPTPKPPRQYPTQFDVARYNTRQTRKWRFNNE